MKESLKAIALSAAMVVTACGKKTEEPKPTFDEWAQEVGLDTCKREVEKQLGRTGIWASETDGLAETMCNVEQTRPGRYVEDKTYEYDERIYLDRDGDGFSFGSSDRSDCSDADMFVFPGAEEVCDGKDNDCDGQVDNVPDENKHRWKFDKDHDGAPSAESVLACDKPEIAYEKPLGFEWEVSKDCNDNDPSVRPDENEPLGVYDGIDNNCDGLVDWGMTPPPSNLPIPKVYVDMKTKETAEISWESVVQTVNNNMGHGWGDESEFRLVYGLLWPRLSQHEYKGDEPFQETLNTIYRSPALQEAVYTWAMPSISANFAMLSEEDQKGYLEIARHTRRYLGEFNYAEERDYYQTLAKATCPDRNWFDEGRNCVRYFTKYGPGEEWKVARRAGYFESRPEPDKYRKAEAWAFRRVNEGDMTPGELRKWIGRIERDLRKAIAD